MAKLRYTGKDIKRIPGVGPIGNDWVSVPDHIAAEHDTSEEKAAGWDVQRDPAPKPAKKGGDDK